MSSATPANPLFAIPELLAMAALLVPRGDLLSLLLVNRAFFACAAALVWREVPGIDMLLSLLPPEGPATAHSVDGAAQDLPMAAGRRSRDGWQRFDLYAPFVQTLLMSGRHSIASSRYDLPGLERTRGSKSLLPNLRSLVIDRRAKNLAASTLRDLLSVFYCDSWTSVEIRGDFPGDHLGGIELPRALDMIWGAVNLCRKFGIYEIMRDPDFGCGNVGFTHGSSPL
ncbi:hypothetical protein FRC08_013599 [Ceratobasidium sp. 394]|nr:hypothetical protein FRC08_013599 [Ceratobasidium sp. 394]